MYLEHFGLSEPPFRITPHTDFFFDGADRGATLEALIYSDPERRGHRQGERRGRQRQDDALPRADRALAGAGRNDLSHHAFARARRDPVRDRRRTAARVHPGPHERRPARASGTPDQAARRGPPRRGADRRSARDAGGDARAGPPAVEPRNQPPQAAADRAVRPARARRGARQAVAAPAQGPHHAQLPHAPAVRSRGRALPVVSHARRGLPRPGRVHAQGGGAHRARLGRLDATHQHPGRQVAALRLQRGHARRHRASRAGRDRRFGVLAFAAREAPRALPGRGAGGGNPDRPRGSLGAARAAHRATRRGACGADRSRLSPSLRGRAGPPAKPAPAPPADPLPASRARPVSALPAQPARSRPQRRRPRRCSAASRRSESSATTAAASACWASASPPRARCSSASRTSATASSSSSPTTPTRHAWSGSFRVRAIWRCCPTYT